VSEAVIAERDDQERIEGLMAPPQKLHYAPSHGRFGAVVTACGRPTHLIDARLTDDDVAWENDKRRCRICEKSVDAMRRAEEVQRRKIEEQEKHLIVDSFIALGASIARFIERQERRARQVKVA
jgi:hypothetical protein